MYSKSISRDEPGCLVFLLDRSDSMGQPWGESGHTLAEGAADVLNRLLFEFCVRATKHDGKVLDYFDIGIFGYGERPLASGEGAESAFGGFLLGRELVPLSELDANPLTLVQDDGDAPGAPGRPVWVSPVHGGLTPMCEAIFTAGDVVANWIQRHHTSYPPIVVNITDGLVTDEPFQGAGLVEWADRLRSLTTADGNVLLLNIFLSVDNAVPQVLFPASTNGMQEPGDTLFRMSSPLPPQMVHQAQANGISVQPGARGLCLNADMAMLAKFLEIGTRHDFKDR